MPIRALKFCSGICAQRTAAATRQSCPIEGSHAAGDPCSAHGDCNQAVVPSSRAQCTAAAVRQSHRRQRQSHISGSVLSARRLQPGSRALVLCRLQPGSRVLFEGSHDVTIGCRCLVCATLGGLAVGRHLRMPYAMLLWRPWQARGCVLLHWPCSQRPASTLAQTNLAPRCSFECSLFTSLVSLRTLVHDLPGHRSVVVCLADYITETPTLPPLPRRLTAFEGYSASTHYVRGIGPRMRSVTA